MMPVKRLLAVSGSFLVLGVLTVHPGCFTPSASQGEFRSSSLVAGPEPEHQKSWQSAQIIDIGAIDLSSSSINRDTNQDYQGTTYNIPMAVFNNAVKSFYVLFNWADVAPPAVTQKMSMYATTPVSFDGNLWGTGLGSFVQLDVNSTVVTPGDSLKPITKTDAQGNTIAVFLTWNSENALNARRPFAVRHSNGSWSTPQRLAHYTETGNVYNSIGLNVDAYGNTIIAWIQNSKCYFNQYRPFLGWRFAAGATSHTTFHDTGGASTALDLGIDVGFDGYGNGYAAYVQTTGTFGRVAIVRWKGNDPSNWATADADTYQALSTPAAVHDRYPKLHVRPDGGATVFFYRNYAANKAELWYAMASATTSSTAPSFSAAARFDSSVGTGTVTMQDGNDILGPILATSGLFGAIGFVKSDGSTNRFWVSRYEGTLWSTPVSIDLARGDVVWADLAMNGSGEIAAVYAAIDNTDGYEHVYGVKFENGAWSTPVQLDNTNSRTGSVSATTDMRPSISIDAEGNAMITYSNDDTTALFATPRRRAMAVMYR